MSSELLPVPEPETEAQLRAKLGLPTSSTDNTIPRFNGTGGDLQTSGVAIDDSNNVTGVVALTCSGALQSLSLTVTATSGTGITLGASAGTSSAIASSLGNIIRHRAYGYSTAYSAVQVGDASHSVGFGVDPATITGGQFTGDSTDIFFTRGAAIGCPNAGATDWRWALKISGGRAFKSEPTLDVSDSGVRSRELLTLDAGVTFGNEALSTYDEGTWTPTILGLTTPGSHTYSVQNGRYIRIGRQVTAWFYVSVSSKDAAMAGNIAIGGLPFTAKNTANQYGGGSVAECAGVTFADMLGVEIPPNVTTAALIKNTSGGSAAPVAAADIGATPYLIGRVDYEAN